MRAAHKNHRLYPKNNENTPTGIACVKETFLPNGMYNNGPWAHPDNLKQDSLTSFR